MREKFLRTDLWLRHVLDAAICGDANETVFETSTHYVDRLRLKQNVTQLPASCIENRVRTL